jgi:hypothetical protein
MHLQHLATTIKGVAYRRIVGDVEDWSKGNKMGIM